MGEGPQTPLLDVRQRDGQDFDVQTMDRGRENATVVTSVLRNGELVVTRSTPYLPNSPVDFVRNMMMLLHQEVLTELDGGALEKEISASLAGPSGPAAPVPEPASRAAIHNNPQQLHSSVAVVTYHPPPAGGRPTYDVKFPEPRSILEVYYTRGNQHGLVVETQDLTDLGKPVDIRVLITRPRDRLFALTGVVTWKRPRGTQALKPGIGVEFSKDCSAALDKMVEVALGILDPTQDRAHPRIPCSISGTLVTPVGNLNATAKNLSLGGALVELENAVPAAPGMQVTLTLKTGFLFSLKLPARVQWTAHGPKRLGIMFSQAAPKGLVDLLNKLLKS